MKKRCLSLLLSLLILVSLCVSAAPSAAADDAEKVYVTKQKELLVRKEERGQDLPSWKNAFPGRSLDKITEYEYDEFGNVTSETVSYDYLPVGVKAEDLTYTYDDQGQILQAECTESNVYNLLHTRKTVWNYENGRICRIEQIIEDWYGLLNTSVYEFNEQGYCTYFANSWESVGSAEARYEYDENENLTFLAVSVNGGPEQTMTPVYEDGRQVALKHVAPDGGEVMEYFRYDEQGRLNLIEYDAEEIIRYDSDLFTSKDFPNAQFLYNDYRPGNKHVTVAMNYNELDLVNDAEWRTNGEFKNWTRYSYTVDKDKDNAISYEISSGAYGPYFWGEDSLAGTNWFDYSKLTTRDGNTRREYKYEFKILGASPRYVKTSIQYEYETQNVKVEMSPTAAVTDNAQLAPEDFYPALPESYLGTPVPTPDGSKRLVRAVVEKAATELPVITELAYAEDGSFAGAVTSFDATGEYDDWQGDDETRTDDQGRLTYDYDQSRWGNTTYTYTYAEDGQSYTFSSRRGENEPYERVISLADLQIPELVKRPADEFAFGDTAEYNDDGLPLRIGVNFKKDGDGNLVEEIREYSYQWKTEDNVSYSSGFEATKNATVLKQFYETSWATVKGSYLVFDDHGYLTAYYPLGSGSISFHYYYE